MRSSEYIIDNHGFQTGAFRKKQWALLIKLVQRRCVSGVPGVHVRAKVIWVIACMMAVVTAVTNEWCQRSR